MKTIKVMYIIFLALIGAVLAVATTTHIAYDDTSIFSNYLKVDVRSEINTPGMIAYCAGYTMDTPNACGGFVNLVSLDYAVFGQPLNNTLASNLIYRNLNSTYTNAHVMLVYQDNANDDKTALVVRNDAKNNYIQSWSNETNTVAYIVNNGTFYGKGFLTFTFQEMNYNGDMRESALRPEQMLDEDDKLNVDEGVYEGCGHLENVTIYNDEFEVIGYEMKLARDVDCINVRNALLVSELIEENDLLKTELCARDNTYSFCAGMQELG